ncbi:MAG: HAMP domain-containing histidine kinase [Pirellula sp.]|nr:HAMP domain-containing histidine kinase [Pirellula sp.]
MFRSVVKSLVGSWSLERKSLVFLGIAIVVSMVLALFAIQFVAQQLVMETARQSARDYANAYIGWKHLYAIGKLDPVSLEVETDSSVPAADKSKLLEHLRAFMLQSQFVPYLLRLDDNLEHESLKGDVATGTDLPRLENIHAKLAERDSIANEDRQAANSGTVSRPESAEPSAAAAIPTQGKPSATSSLTFSSPAQAFVFEEAGPYDGYYYYYHPLTFRSECRECHVRLVPAADSSISSIDPFRVLRVQMPDSYARFWSIWSYSILTSIAIGTVAISLFFIHIILKRLVIRPVLHMKEVSERITQGDTTLRFQLDTDDEFHDLSESFNAMLRHLTNIQNELQDVNVRMNGQVDELARINLELFEANRLKGEFLANMSHELRTPLNSILGFSEVLQGFETLTDKQRRFVNNIQLSGRKLLEMINDILDLAKVEAGKMQVKTSEFDLVGLIHSQCDLVRPLAEQKNIDVRVDADSESILVYQDQSKVQQILTNLLSNAIKFTPEGGLITVHCLSREDDVIMSVSDTGVGIAIEDHDIVFEKFRQARRVTGVDGLTREHSGTGLGLSIVRELCTLLGGDIGLSSQVGFGSTFRVKLPLRYSSNE